MINLILDLEEVRKICYEVYRTPMDGGIKADILDLINFLLNYISALETNLKRYTPDMPKTDSIVRINPIRSLVIDE